MEEKQLNKTADLSDDEALDLSLKILANLKENLAKSGLGPYRAAIEPVPVGNFEPRKRRVYIDTEFIPSNTSLSGLISIGLVDDQGGEYYAVNSKMNGLGVVRHPWLGKNVWPYLPQTKKGELDLGHPDVKTPAVIRKELTEFFAKSECEVWSWYGAQDLVRLHSLWDNDWARMPEDIPRWHHELQSAVVKRGNPQLPAQESQEHHALADAKYHKQLHEFLHGPRLFEYPVC